MTNQIRMSAVATRLAAPSDDERTFEIAGGVLAIGDPLTDSAATFDVGASSVALRFLELDDLASYHQDDDDEAGEDDDLDDPDAVAVGIRVRAAAVTRWIEGGAAGVDSGTLAVWDASQTHDPASAADVDGIGLMQLAGRPVFVIPTEGDGAYPTVIGYDAANQIACILAGPAINPAWFVSPTP